jgi:hypothetical protein
VIYFGIQKNESQSGVINRNICLLGDPSLSLPWVALSTFLKKDSLFIGSESIKWRERFKWPCKTKWEMWRSNFIRFRSKKEPWAQKRLLFEYQVEGDLRGKFKTQIQQNAFAFPSKNLTQFTREIYVKNVWDIITGR